MKVDTTILDLDDERAKEMSYIASMGIYIVSKDVMLNFLRDNFPGANDFGSEVIPGAIAIGLRVLVVLCLMVSLMLFCERVYMSIVIVLVKLFGRKPDKRYKFEPLRDDVDFENSDYPHVPIQIPMFNEKEAYKLSFGAACGISWHTDHLVIQVLDDSTDPTIKDYKGNEISRTSSKFQKQKENHQEPGTLEQEMAEKSENNIITSLTEKAMTVVGPVVPTKEHGEVV